MFLPFILLLSLVEVFSLRCYEGSKGLVNGVEQSNFRETSCDENMVYCFNSYNDDFTDVTASCQTPRTDEKLLSVCETGCLYHSDINVTVCCCDIDLCNMPQPPTTTPPTTTPLTTILLTTTRLTTLPSPKPDNNDKNSTSLPLLDQNITTPLS